MDEQQETSRVLDLRQLDLILSFLPNPRGAKVLRDQIVSGCRIVEAKEDEVEALHGRAANQSDRLQAQLEELDAERQAFRVQRDQEIDSLQAERVKLENLAQTLDSQFQDLATNAGQVADKVNNCQTAVAEKLEGFGKVISDRSSEREETMNVLTQSLKDYSASVEKNTEDLSSMKDKSSAIEAAVESVKDDQKRIESSLKSGVTMQGMMDTFNPLVELANATKNTIDGLPTVEFLKAKFDDVGRLANDFAQQAKAQLEENEETFRQKNDKIDELQEARQDLLRRLTEANSRVLEGERAKRQLDGAQHVLQTAEVNRQELAEVKLKLQQAEQTTKERDQKVVDLQGKLESEKRSLDRCSAQLTKALSNNRDINHQKDKLEDEFLKVRNELNQLRAQETLDLQQQLKDQCVAVREAMKQQASEQGSHNETIRQLEDSWSSEKEALTDQISVKGSLIENQEQQLKTLQSRVSVLEPLREQLDAATNNTNRVEALLEQARSSLKLSEQKITQFEEVARVSAKELEDLKAENVRLQESGESVSQQLRRSNATIESLQEECNGFQNALSTLQAQSVTIPEGAAGEICSVFYRAADELRNIPIVLDPSGKLGTPQLAAQLIAIIEVFDWKETLLRFLHSKSKGWFCLQHLLKGDSNGLVAGGQCQHHDDCLLVMVESWSEPPTLRFIKNS
ncbi:hypothetical protein FGADI_12498 [Fusarium gaditjirri]|uniref:Uncharacterized protein n=1 Tax=Fusarium gaditjirri TaxID=282569 RepID=A0A8H4SSC3_9HYPO|nr:hypothetical protein FGADI_12498 [Fusarium gaditjirri]